MINIVMATVKQDNGLKLLLWIFMLVSDSFENFCILLIISREHYTRVVMPMKISTNRLRSSSSAISNVIHSRKTTIDKIINLPAGTLALLAAIGFLSVMTWTFSWIHLELNAGSIASAIVCIYISSPNIIRIIDGTLLSRAGRLTQQQVSRQSGYTQQQYTTTREHKRKKELRD